MYDPTDEAKVPHRIEIKLRDISQLFNTMDPSPFYEKDLDADAEEFIVSWAREFPVHEPVVLTIHVTQPGVHPLPDGLVERAVQNYFAYRGTLSRMEFSRLMREGRLSLLIGMMFLTTCLIVARLMAAGASPALSIAREGLTILGWVAMWRPLEIYLYDWWPVRRRWKIFEKMAHMKVEIHEHDASADLYIPPVRHPHHVEVEHAA